MALISPIFRQPSAAAPPIGIVPAPIDFPMSSTVSVALGDIMAVSVTPDSAGNLSAVAQAATADFSPGSDGITEKIFCVALQAIPANGTGYFRFAGICQVNLAASTAAGKYVIPTNAARTGTELTTGAVGAGFKVIAQVLVSTAASGLNICLVDGFGLIRGGVKNTT